MKTILLAMLLLTYSGLSQAAIGIVSDTKGTACEVTRGKAKISGVKGADIETMDTYVTGACVSNIKFKDDTTVKITENSKLLIDDFVYDPKKSDAGKLSLKAAMGTVRYASGQIAKNNPQQVAVTTPTANIAVRGTDFTMTVDETGQSLIMLVPSCKDDKDVKKYELEENKCKVGKIEVSTGVGTVVLDKAFEATYVTSFTMAPTAPTVVNIVESKINNGLIISKPGEVTHAIREQAKTKQERELDEIEAEAQRRLAQRVKESADAIEAARVLAMMEAAGKNGCNPSTGICVIWEKNDSPDIQSKGKGVAFRINTDHYAEVKTQGYESNTFITITHNDAPATYLIGSGDPGGNIVNIKQNTGVLRRP
jgi:hypothetical protein